MTVLTVSVIINAMTPPQWVVRTLSALHDHELIQINCIFLQSLNDDVVDTPDSKAPLYKAPLYRACKWLSDYIDRPRFPTSPLQPEPLPAQLQAVLVDATKPFEIASPTDLVLHLGNTDTVPPNTPAAKNGIWFVKHEELVDYINVSLLQRPSLLWIHLWKWVGTDLVAPERVGSHALPLQSFSKTDLQTCGFGCLPDFILSRVNWLAQGLDPQLYEANQVSTNNYAADAFPSTPHALTLTQNGFCWRTIRLFFLQTKVRLRKRFQYEQWQLGFLKTNAHAAEHKLQAFRELKPTSNMTWADPHLLIHNGQTHVFFEELEHKENKGRIATAVLTEDGFQDAPKTVLNEPYHLSYPFVFEYENVQYMIPETATRRTIRLYKANAFPDDWEHVGNIMDNINAADTTVFRRDGLWWLFTNGMSHPSVDERDQLLLFHAEDLLSGDWQAHPLNPVVTGVDRARMGGAVYEKDGQLFRPSQYGANRYGFGVNLSMITQLNKTNYQETLVSRLTPESNTEWIGCHTAVHSDELVIVDRLKRVSRLHSG